MNSEQLIDTAGFDNDLIAWGKANFRSFPWRLTNDPYLILIAELMLHRTQAKQVVRVYEEFIARYPNIQALAQASEVEVESALHSLGLRWRNRLVKKMAEELVARYGGRVPVDGDQLISLPGVSEYIAGCVRCFTWNLPEAIVDTNTVRVVGRLFDLEIKESSRRNPTFRKLIRGLVDITAPRDYNFALLDLADKICIGKGHPLHRSCPVLTYCRQGNLHLRSETHVSSA